MVQKTRLVKKGKNKYNVNFQETTDESKTGLQILDRRKGSCISNPEEIKYNEQFSAVIP